MSVTTRLTKPSKARSLESALTDASLLTRLVAVDARARQLIPKRELHSRVLHLLSSWEVSNSTDSTRNGEYRSRRQMGNAERARLLEKRLATSEGYDWRREKRKVDGMRMMRENILLIGRLMRIRETPSSLNGERLMKEYVHKQFVS